MPSRFWFLIEIGAVVRAVTIIQWGGSMIRQMADIYVRLLKLAFLIALGAGLTISTIESERSFAKEALKRGLVRIPEIGK